MGVDSLRRLSWTAILLVGGGCTGDSPDTDETGDEGPLAHVFSFAVLADPHITGDAERTERLRSAVAWIDAETEARSIELVVVVGDIGWSAGLQTSRDLLDELDVPYVPVLGDNEIQAGDEAAFSEVFGPQLTELASRFDDPRRTIGSSHNPDHDVDSWFVNLSFSHRGVRFVALDWASREIGTLYGEMADLHDFEGGSWPWFEEEVGGLEEGVDESVVMLSHHPMHVSPGAFDAAEIGRIAAHTAPLAARFAGNYAGHYHFDHEEFVEQGGYDVFVTDATWDDINRVRLVEVWGNTARFEYRQELIDIP